MEKPKENIKDKSIRLRVTEQQHDIIKRRANAAQMTMTDFIKESCLNDSAIHVIPNSKDILSHLSRLSNCINLLDDEELQEEMVMEAMYLWRYLNS